MAALQDAVESPKQEFFRRLNMAPGATAKIVAMRKELLGFMRDNPDLAEINRDEGVTMLIVEQNANLALGVADRGFVLEAGQTVIAGTADELAEDEAVRRAYLGY